MSDTVQRAEALVELGRYRDAERMLHGILADEPESTEAMAALASAVGRQGRRTEAVQIARHAVSCEPGSSRLLELLATQLIESDQTDEARRVALRAVQADPTSWPRRYTYAWSLLAGSGGDPQAALAVVEETLPMAPGSSHLHNLAGWALKDLGREDEARAAYAEALRLDPGNSLVLNNLAALELGHRRLGRASRLVTAALQADPQRPLLHRTHAVVLTRLMRRVWVSLLVAVAAALLLAVGREPWALRAAVLPVAVLGAFLWCRSAAVGLPRGTLDWRRLVAPTTSAGVRALTVGFVLLALALVVAVAAPPGPAAALGHTLLPLLRLVWLATVVGLFSRPAHRS